jgi:hypothetical protein
MIVASIVPLILAAAAPSAEDRMAIEEAVVGIFAPFTTENPGASWDFPVYSEEVTALIAKWKSVIPESEPDGLNDGDWLCQCQDWDAAAFQATITSVTMTGARTAEVEVSLDLGFGAGEAGRGGRLLLRREGEAWKIDDIVAEPFPSGLRQALHETIAADEALLAAGKPE